MTGQEFKNSYAKGERDFQNADLRGADLNGADMYISDLRGAQIDPGALSPKQIADGCFDDDILEKQGWVRKADVAQEVPQPPRKLHAIKVEFDDIEALTFRVLNEDITREQQGEAIDKLARAWNLNVNGDVIAAAELMEDVNELLA